MSEQPFADPCIDGAPVRRTVASDSEREGCGPKTRDVIRFQSQRLGAFPAPIASNQFALWPT